MLIDDIHHVSLNVSDVDRSLGFYRDLLGLRPLERPAFSFAGAWLDGGAQYKLTVPADVPARQFWSALVHDVDTAAWFTDLPIHKEGIASFTEGLETNADGSVDVYFGPEAPSGKETNWLPTVTGKKFFLIF